MHYYDAFIIHRNIENRRRFCQSYLTFCSVICQYCRTSTSCQKKTRAHAPALLSLSLIYLRIKYPCVLVRHTRISVNYIRPILLYLRPVPAVTPQGLLLPTMRQLQARRRLPSLFISTQCGRWLQFLYFRSNSWNANCRSDCVWNIILWNSYPGPAIFLWDNALS
jgi:hypothetical protein